MTRFGFACINTEVKGGNGGYILKTIKQSPDPFNLLVEKSRENLLVVAEILKWNRKHNIKFYRLSSKIFPHIGNKKLLDILTPEQYESYLNLEPFSKELATIKKIAKGTRLSMHPEHFCHLASLKEQVVSNTLTDLHWHAKLLEAVSENSNYNPSTICLHGGGQWGNKEETKKRLTSRLKALPTNIKKMVCLENCEKSWSAEDLLPVCFEVGIPLIFDFFHYRCFSLLHPGTQAPIEVLLPKILATWRNRRPKFHISEQSIGKPIGSHSDYVYYLPAELVKMARGFDVMVEAKMKERNVLFLQKKYQNM